MMNPDLKLESFLKKNNISKDTWKASGCDWPTLLAIGADHEKNVAVLGQSADFFAKLIQAFPAVHSVRWRVKETEHLLEKIVRKKASGSEKYDSLNLENYFTIVTDLVGIRALHLFKDDCFHIDATLRGNWQPVEPPIAYTRAGDDEEFLEQLRAQGFATKSHPAGYRSVHYVLESQPLARKVIMEVQVRTIFEEGWSEIDHKVRYPNFSDNKLVTYLLTIFNRMAGSADEMGGFVRGLAMALEEYETQMTSAISEKARILDAMENTLVELDNVRRQDQESKANISKLKEEIQKLKAPAASATSSSVDLVKALEMLARFAAYQKNANSVKTIK